MRVSSLKYRYLASADPVKYEVFYVECPILELYAEFGNIGEGKWRSISFPIRKVGAKEEAESPSTWLCSGFTTLLESSHYDIPESSIGKHSSVPSLDFYSDKQNVQQSSPMFYPGNTYKGMSSSFIDWQSAGDFGCTVSYTRKDDVLPTTSIGKGTSNPGLARGCMLEL
ncbi:hypothetical protein J1N35_015681 [Gossypium stocksii]|uniref:Uncharacterized protein n=1 Tax=Gossypium stocksii TaxID=47602 RepID=A0A9D3VXG0_9ROSI|nr:hypothetical protein J1N35_015681 [Gossypium stocksii]